MLRGHLGVATWAAAAVVGLQPAESSEDEEEGTSADSESDSGESAESVASSVGGELTNANGSRCFTHKCVYTDLNWAGGELESLGSSDSDCESEKNLFCLKLSVPKDAETWEHPHPS